MKRLWNATHENTGAAGKGEARGGEIVAVAEWKSGRGWRDPSRPTKPRLVPTTTVLAVATAQRLQGSPSFFIPPLHSFPFLLPPRARHLPLRPAHPSAHDRSKVRRYVRYTRRHNAAYTRAYTRRGRPSRVLHAWRSWTDGWFGGGKGRRYGSSRGTGKGDTRGWSGIEVVVFSFSCFCYTGGKVDFSSVVWYGEIYSWGMDSLVDSCVYEELKMNTRTRKVKRDKARFLPRD